MGENKGYTVNTKCPANYACTGDICPSVSGSDAVYNDTNAGYSRPACVSDCPSHTKSNPMAVGSVAKASDQQTAINDVVNEVKRLRNNPTGDNVINIGEKIEPSTIYELYANLEKVGISVTRPDTNEVTVPGQMNHVYSKLNESLQHCICFQRCTCNSRAQTVDYNNCSCHGQCSCDAWLACLDFNDCCPCACDCQCDSRCWCNKLAWVKTFPCTCDCHCHGRCHCNLRGCHIHITCSCDSRCGCDCHCHGRCSCDARTSVVCSCNIRRPSSGDPES